MVFQHSDRTRSAVREATESDISFYQLSRRLGPVARARSRLRAAGSAGADGRRTARGIYRALIVKPRRRRVYIRRRVSRYNEIDNETTALTVIRSRSA